MKTVKSRPDLTCDNIVQLSGDGPMSQVKAVERILQIDSSEQINDTLTKEELRHAAEMFVYLIMCPETIKPWLVFYRDLFLTQSLDQIILTLNRMMTGQKTKSNEFFKTLAGILLNTIFNTLPGKSAGNIESTAGDEARPPQELEGDCSLFIQLLCSSFS